MNSKDIHAKEVRELQEQLKNLYTQRESLQNPTPIALKYHVDHSYTIRTKTYKNGCHTIDCGALNRIIAIDSIKRIAIVEPRVTMEALLQATLPYGLTPPIIPELREMTVGGAIMGMAAESASHQWGTFNDTCTAFEVLCGDGSLLKVSPEDNPDIFYGIPGSYGSLGTLVSAEIKLIPAKDFVHLCYHIFPDPHQAVQALLNLSHSTAQPDFLDGIVFSKKLAVVIEGKLESKDRLNNLTKFSTQPFSSEMYFQHVKKIALAHHSTTYEEIMTHDDYFFRYDLGAFWMGAYLFHFPILSQLTIQGLLKNPKITECFTPNEIERFHHIPDPSGYLRTFFRPFMTSHYLEKQLHRAEKWVQNRFIIQDFCIPEKHAFSFLEAVLDDPGVFPIWLLPLKGTNHPQIFAPHLLSDHEQGGAIINFGIYGIPAFSIPIRQMTKRLEQKTQAYGGRKALYSRSYYDQNEFWNIYSYKAYEALREKMLAKGVWHEITDKVLSE